VDEEVFARGGGGGGGGGGHVPDGDERWAARETHEARTEMTWAGLTYAEFVWKYPADCEDCEPWLVPNTVSLDAPDVKVLLHRSGKGTMWVVYRPAGGLVETEPVPTEEAEDDDLPLPTTFDKFYVAANNGHQLVRGVNKRNWIKRRLHFTESGQEYTWFGLSEGQVDTWRVSDEPSRYLTYRCEKVDIPHQLVTVTISEGHQGQLDQPDVPQVTFPIEVGQTVDPMYPGEDPLDPSDDEPVGVPLHLRFIQDDGRAEFKLVRTYVRDYEKSVSVDFDEQADLLQDVKNVVRDFADDLADDLDGFRSAMAAKLEAMQKKYKRAGQRFNPAKMRLLD